MNFAIKHVATNELEIQMKTLALGFKNIVAQIKSHKAF